MNMLYDKLPGDLRDEVYEWLRTHAADERKATDTDGQFFYKTRKKALGPFKSQMWNLPEDVRADLGVAWERQFRLLFERLNVVDTWDLVQKTVEPVKIHKTPADYGAAEKAAEDVTGLAD
jgi:hypothetical protein